MSGDYGIVYAVLGFFLLFVVVLVGWGVWSQHDANDAIVRCVEAGGRPSECAQSVSP